ncbi:deleted in malignant brain tumors 1 protein-like [Haliotis rubra]|uniref:deleted in malignant brain tumors 1 protein-like n=1 Tax=Haliotis rubra TaxID=36100 RepID=UPI001EE5C2BF|nr:deleted in malignant brain tumors 1 protein-like [Haliotis rubra]
MVIVSPGYPSNYVNGLDCQWTINAPIGTNITAKVLFLDLEKGTSCVDDYLLFKDGTTNDAHQLAKICERRSTPIVSCSNHMTIIFHSDSTVTGGGFRLQYYSASVCGLSDISASSVTWKYLTSPGYPSSYDNNMYCKWTISAPVGFKVKVEVHSISMQYDAFCSKDYVLFSDGSSRLGKYCSDVTEYIVSSSNAMTITFRTDSSVTDKGISLKYIARTKGCFEDDTISYETKYVESPNYPLSYPE